MWRLTDAEIPNSHVRGAVVSLCGDGGASYLGGRCRCYLLCASLSVCQAMRPMALPYGLGPTVTVLQPSLGFKLGVGATT